MLSPMVMSNRTRGLLSRRCHLPLPNGFVTRPRTSPIRLEGELPVLVVKSSLGDNLWARVETWNARSLPGHNPWMAQHGNTLESANQASCVGI